MSVEGAPVPWHMASPSLSLVVDKVLREVYSGLLGPENVNSMKNNG